MTEIIQRVLDAIRGRVGAEADDLVQDVLVMQLNQYEVMERCTEVAVRDDSAEGLLKKFIATKRVEGFADSTLRRYTEINMALINYLGKPLEEITTYDIRFYLSVRHQVGKVSNRTIDGMRRCYSGFFKWLAAEKLIPHNPCMALAQIKCQKTVKKPYSAAEMEKIRKACGNMRNLALVDFLYATGCRVSEVARLDISDVDFERMECIVLGKGNKERKTSAGQMSGLHTVNTRHKA